MKTACVCCVRGDILDAFVRSTNSSCVQSALCRTHMRTKMALEVQYLGTRFIGWQPQPAVDGMAVFEAVHTALHAVGLPGGPVASGRTDKGVHAMSNWLTVTVHRPPGRAVAPGPQRDAELEHLCAAINENLPTDVRCLRIVDAPPTAHAMTGAEGKVYSYFVLDGCTGALAAECTGAWSNACWVLPETLDVQKIRKALPGLMGYRDFRQLCAIKDPRRDTRRTIHQASVCACSHRHFALLGCFEQTRPAARIVPGACSHCCGNCGGGSAADTAGDVDGAAGRPRLLQIRFAGDGFLKHQVRRMVGLLVAIGCGMEDPSATESITHEPSPPLQAQEAAARAGDTQHRTFQAPAAGLWLESVDCRRMLSASDDAQTHKRPADHAGACISCTEAVQDD